MCKHLYLRRYISYPGILDNAYCKASPCALVFVCLDGKFHLKNIPNYNHCRDINKGFCNLFEDKNETSEI